MIVNKVDRKQQKQNKDAAMPCSQKKCHIPNLIPRMKIDRPYKQNQGQQATPALKLKNKTHYNCFPPNETPWGSKKTPTTLKIKSASLVELPSEEKKVPKQWTHRKTVSREKTHNSNPSAQIENRSSTIFEFVSKREKELAQYVTYKFVLHTWRKRNAQTKAMEAVKSSLKNEVANLNIQNSVLKNLLGYEEKRVGLVTSDLKFVKEQLEEEVKTSNRLKELIVTLEEDKVLLRSKEKQMEEKMQLLKSDIEAKSIHSSQLNEKLQTHENKLHDSKKLCKNLRDKNDSLEASIKEKMNDLNTLKNKCLDFQIKVESLISKNQELVNEKDRKDKQIVEYVNKLMKCEVEINNLQNLHKDQGSDIVKLKNECQDTKIQINNKDTIIEHLQDSIKQYDAEKEELSKKFKAAVHRFFVLSLNFIPLPNHIHF